jgi:hypothetical protein
MATEKLTVKDQIEINAPKKKFGSIDQSGIH